MDSASKELAVTRQVEAVGGVGRRRNDNIWIWVIILIVLFCFCGDGFGNWGGGYDYGRRHHHHHHRHRQRSNNNFFGDNGWFILIIFAALFLFNDGFGGANTNIINVDADDEGL